MPSDVCRCEKRSDEAAGDCFVAALPTSRRNVSDGPPKAGSRDVSYGRRGGRQACAAREALNAGAAGGLTGGDRPRDMTLDLPPSHDNGAAGEEAVKRLAHRRAGGGVPD